MDPAILKTMGQLAGVAGIALGVLLLLFRDVIRKNIFAGLTKQQSFRLLALILVLVWSVALAGIVAWVWISLDENAKQPADDPPSTTDVTAPAAPSVSPVDQTLVKNSLRATFVSSMVKALKKNMHNEDQMPALVREVVCSEFDKTVYYNLRAALTSETDDPRIERFDAECNVAAANIYGSLQSVGLDGSGAAIIDEDFEDTASEHVKKACFELLPCAWKFFD